MDLRGGTIVNKVKGKTHIRSVWWKLGSRRLSPGFMSFCHKLRGTKEKRRDDEIKENKISRSIWV